MENPNELVTKIELPKELTEEQLNHTTKISTVRLIYLYKLAICNQKWLQIETNEESDVLELVVELKEIENSLIEFNSLPIQEQIDEELLNPTNNY